MATIESIILNITSAEAIKSIDTVQSLWKGYGAIKRYSLIAGEYESIIVKQIKLIDGINPSPANNSTQSHQRKLQSYQVETNWYQDYAHLCHEDHKVPRLLYNSTTEQERILMMEDLNASGYSIRHTPDSISFEEIKNCLIWLANFHAHFMGSQAAGLWEKGTYWHLDTRKEEWAHMNNKPLKELAQSIDDQLDNAQYQTLVHGDAKLANFCFHEKGDLAAVDFQYVGKGCGMKDVAYFISSCLEEEECAQYEKELLNHYFQHLENALPADFDFISLKEEWTEMYDYAWADFYRFLDGWKPGHWKMHEYSRSITQKVIARLKKA